MNTEIKKKLTLGKRLGLISFVICEIMAIMVVIAITVNVFFENRIDAGMIGNLLFFQGSIFTIVWGAKASSNFSKRNINFSKRNIKD